MQKHINKLPEELRNLWNENYTQSVQDKIDHTAKLMARDAAQLSPQAQEELFEVWEEDAAHARDTAKFFLSVSGDATEGEDEWKAGAMDNLVSYVFRKMTIDAVRNASHGARAVPPQQALGESTEHYKQRLLEYMDSLK